MLPDEQARIVCGACGFDVLVDHWLCLVLSRGPDRFFWLVRRMKSLYGCRSTGRRSDQKASALRRDVRGDFAVRGSFW